MNTAPGTSHVTPQYERISVPAIILTVAASFWLLLGGVLVTGETPVIIDGSHPHSDEGDFHVMGWMWHRSMMDHAGLVPSWMWFNIGGGLVFLFAAGALYLQPALSSIWGILIIAVSVISLFVAMGGIFVGILGIIGGLLAFFQPAGKT